MNMKPASPPIPTSVIPRIEFPNVSSSWITDRWGPSHHHVDDGLRIDYWAFQFDSGIYGVLEHLPKFDTLLVHSDSTDTQMLRSAFGLEGFEGGDMRPWRGGLR